MDEKVKGLANDIMKRCQEQGLTCREAEKALELVRMRVGEQKSNAANAAAFTAKPFKFLSKEKDAALIEISEGEIPLKSTSRSSISTGLTDAGTFTETSTFWRQRRRKLWRSL